jgi:N-acetylglucosaminyl-diphospho-decaprenol L-rhamnosyltransferase
MSRTRIVIVNYRTAGLVVECLRSLEGDSPDDVPGWVVVVDNGSGDGSAERLGEAIQAANWGAWVTLLPLPVNRGFAAGNNAALRLILAGGPATRGLTSPGSPGQPDAVLLLNPDTVVRPGAVRALVDFLDRNPRVGIAGSRLEDPDGAPQRSAFRFPSLAGEFEATVRLGLISRWLHRQLDAPPVRDECHVTDWVAGASMLVRRQVFEAVGLLDEGYFLYFEETDFCRRARRAGWPCWYVPTSRVVHLVGQSTGVTTPSRQPRRMPRYWFESRCRYFEKQHGIGYARLADLVWLTGFALWRLRRRLQGKPDPDPPHLLWDFLRFHWLRFLP